MHHAKPAVFPEKFLWSAASAAYQAEGAWDADGKGPSVWDHFTCQPGRTFQGSTGKIAVDHYHRFAEDVALMAEMGLKAYRFSVSWPRVIPEGRGRINEAGLDFYERLLDALLEKNITPILTLYHWDLPQALQDLYGGWEDRRVVEDFENYCTTLFRRLGDRVKHWISLNEQNYNLINAYQLGTHPPAVCDRGRFFQANHHAFLANAQAIAAFRTVVPDGRIGPSFAYSPAYPASAAPADMLAFENAEEFTNHWWLDTYCRGCYPEAALAYLRETGEAPRIQAGDEKILMAGRPDFIGVNYYQSLTYTTNPPDGIGMRPINTSGRKGTTPASGVAGLYRTAPNPHLATTDWDWAIDPEGLRIGLRRLSSRYGLPMLISENGLGAFDKVTDDGRIHDADRIAYLNDHIGACRDAIADGVALIGYCVWSFTDLLSWLNGYQKRYGLVYVDRDETDGGSLRRLCKDSFFWYRRIIATNGLIP